MSDTPRTDAAWNRAHTDDIEAGWLFANQLERELNEANADRLRLRQSLTQAGAGQFLATISATPPPAVVAKADADALAKALQAACAYPICGDWLGTADETLQTYHTKYP
jgi:hypothetical protein